MNFRLALKASDWWLPTIASAALIVTMGSASAQDSAAFPFEKKTVETDRASITYVEAGDPAGRPILFLHGIPTSSYLWRNVLPGMRTENRRLIAMDFVGFGDARGKGYGILDQVHHLEDFTSALDLKDIVLVTHDWGAGIGLIWASEHADKITAFATMEGALPPVYPRPDVESFGKAAPVFRRMRDPVEGPRAILEENIWIESIMPGSVAEPLSEDEMAAYRAPFPTPESRAPIYDITQSLPIGGKPADVVATYEKAAEWWKRTDIPKLIIYATPGRLMPKVFADWAEKNLKNVNIAHVGPGVHFLQEDSPDAIAKALNIWLDGLIHTRS